MKQEIDTAKNIKQHDKELVAKVLDMVRDKIIHILNTNDGHFDYAILDDEFSSALEKIENEFQYELASLNKMLKLYTKKDLWERIQHHIRTIDNLRQQLNQQKAMWNELKEWVKLQIDGLNEQLIDDDFDSDYRDISINNFDIMLQKMQELEQGEKDVKS